MKPPPRSSSPSIRARHPEHHLHLDPAQPRGRGRHLHPDGERRGKWQPGHLLDRPLANGSCSISGATVTFVAVGTCVIDANQAGNASYRGRDPGPAVLRSGPWHPEHHLHLDPAQPRGGGRHLHPHGERRGKWQPGHLLDRLLGDGSCSISGATVTFVAVGTCVIDANQAGNASYEAATQVQQSFGPDPGTQSITFTSTPPSPALVGGTYPVTASGGASGNPVTFSIDSSATWKLQHLGCHRHLRRRRDLCHRRQPGRQRQLRGRHPGPAVLRGARHPEHHLHLDPAQPRRRGKHLHPDGERRSKWQPGHLLDRLLRAWKLQHLGCHRHLRRRRDLCHRRQPGRQRQL